MKGRFLSHWDGEGTSRRAIKQFDITEMNGIKGLILIIGNGIFPIIIRASPLMKMVIFCYELKCVVSASNVVGQTRLVVQ